MTLGLCSEKNRIKDDRGFLGAVGSLVFLFILGDGESRLH